MPISPPAQITVPFGTSGLKNTIPAAANQTTGRAGYDAGFPAINMSPVSAGGIPPYGQDMNGILFDITTALQYLEAGGMFVYSSSFATAIGGYPKGALLSNATNDGLWLNTVAGNTTNPDTGGAGWINPVGGRLLAVRTFTANGAYTPTAGTKSVMVECIGGGGSGGGMAATAAGQAAGATGGSGGGYSRKFWATGFSGAAMVVGAGGAQLATTTTSGGNAGGTTSFAVTQTATGGGAGSAIAPTSTFVSFVGTNPPGKGTGGDLNLSGSWAQPTFLFSSASLQQQVGSSGGALGGGTRVNADAAPAAGTMPGDGGSGVARSASLGALNGGAGSPGIITIWEFT